MFPHGVAIVVTWMCHSCFMYFFFFAKLKTLQELRKLPVNSYLESQVLLSCPVHEEDESFTSYKLEVV